MALFACVPMPNTREPPALTALFDGTVSNQSITPLLSAANSETGFCTCCASGMIAGWQALAV